MGEGRVHGNRGREVQNWKVRRKELYRGERSGLGLKKKAKRSIKVASGVEFEAGRVDAGGEAVEEQ
jgi:hypothetical protein